MRSPFDSPALAYQSKFYPEAWQGKVPARVRMTATARSFLRFCLKRTPVALAGTLFDVWVNSNGHVVVIFETGELLGVDHNKVDVVEWHEKGDEIYG